MALVKTVLRDDLVGFFRDASAASFAYGQWDCAMTLANWLERQTGRDPAVELRGRYRTRIGWLRIVAREGGLDRLVGRLAVAAGMCELDLDRLVAGDVGVIEIPRGDRGLAGAIYAGGGRWVTKISDGLFGAPARAVAAWGLRD